jgi:hypothetical protein
MRCAFLMLSVILGVTGIVGCDAPRSADGTAATANARAASLPATIHLKVEGSTDADGFCVVTGTTNLPAGARVLITIAAAPDRGSDLVENAIVDVGADGGFAHRSLLAYPVLYRLGAEFSRAANPDHADWFAPSATIAAQGGAAVERDANGVRVVARATWRTGTETAEADLVRAHTDALAAVLARLRRDRDQVDEKIRPPVAAATRAYAKWARIRVERAHALKLDRPAVDPLFGSLDLALRRLWATLDEVGLAALATAAGDAEEAKHSADAVKRFDRLYEEAEGELARIRGTAK